MLADINDTSHQIVQYYFYPTMECSLSCSHCFINEEIRKSKMAMTVEQFKRVVDQYAEHFHSSDMTNAEVTIMGGEPTLMKPEYYEEVLPYAREKFAAPGKHVFITLMTNFLHLPSLEKTHHLYDFVSTSYEPNRFSEMNKKSKAAEKYDVWLHNLKTWIEADRIVTLSLTTTEDVTSMGTELLDHLYEIGVRYFQINRAYPEGEYMRSVLPPEQFDEHMETRKAERTKAARSRKVIQIHDSKELFTNFENETQYFIDATKWMVNKINNGEFVSVDPLGNYPQDILKGVEVEDQVCGAAKGYSVRGDGHVTGCASEIGNLDVQSWGNLWEQDLIEIHESKERAQFISAQKRISRRCMECEYYAQCKGGCMVRSRLWDDTKDGECHGNKGYMKWVHENIEMLDEAMKRVAELRNDW